MKSAEEQEKTGKCTNLKSLPLLEGPEYITGLD